MIKKKLKEKKLFSNMNIYIFLELLKYISYISFPLKAQYHASMFFIVEHDNQIIITFHIPKLVDE